jgi:hypothetical protein
MLCIMLGFAASGISDHTDDNNDILGGELIEFSSFSDSESDNESSFNDANRGDHQQQQLRKPLSSKEKGRVTFHEMMSFSQVEAGNSLRDRANNCFSSMVVE